MTIKNQKIDVPIRSWRIRYYLIALVFACLLPGLLGAWLLFFYEYRNGREQLKKDAIQTARALVQTVDAHLLQAQGIAQLLASSDSLSRGDIPGFYRRAKGVAATSNLGNNFVLTDATGQQVVNTLKDFGEALPRHGNQEFFRRVLNTGKPAISDLYVGGVLRRPVMSIDVPVVISGKVSYVLSIGILPDKFGDILKAQQLPANRVAAVFDTTGTIVARTHAAEKFVGQKGTEEFIRQIQEIGEGSMETVTREGIPTLSVFSRSPVSGWSVGIGVPRKDLAADLERTLAMLGAGIAAVFGLGFGLALFMSRRVANSVSNLKDLAVALSRGEPSPPISFPVQELEDVARTMVAASTEKKIAEHQVRKSEGDLRQLIATMPGMVWTATKEGTVDFVSRQWLDYTEVALESQLEKGYLEVIHPEDRERVENAWSESVAKHTTFNAEYRLRRHDGAYHWFKSRGEALFDEGGQLVKWLGVVLEIEDLKQAQDALLKSEAQMAKRTAEVIQLAAELTCTEERERRVLACNLHDNLGQLLHVAKVKLVGLEKEGWPDSSQLLLEDLSGLLAEASRQVRSLTSELGSPVLVTLGLPAALHSLCDEMMEAYGLHVFCDVEMTETGLSQAQTAILFRSARELLINVAKHAITDVARLTLQRGGGAFTLTVEDNGKGIQSIREAIQGTQGFGLASIQERILFLGGTMAVETPSAGGVRVSLKMPVPSDDIESQETQ